SQQVAGMSVGAGATPINQVITNTIGNTTLAFNAASTTPAFAGTITDMAPSGGTLGLTLSAGTLDVTSANLTYHGPTTVNSGMLMVSATMPNTSAVNVVGGVLDIVGANNVFSTPIVCAGNIIYTGGSGTLASNIFPGPNLATARDSFSVYSGA